LAQKTIAFAQISISKNETTHQKNTTLAQNNRNLDKLQKSENFKILPKPHYDLYSLEKSIYVLINEERKSKNIQPLEFDDTLSNVARKHSIDQAESNRFTTDIQKPCSYPIIRHEGLTNAGFDISERLDNASVNFRMAGENIVILSISKDSIYTSNAPILCPTLSLTEIPKDAKKEERLKIIKDNISKAERLLESIPYVKWVNREWHDLDTISKRAVNSWMESDGHRKNVLNGKFTKTGIGAAEVNGFIIITQVFIEPPH
jgi:uncharacterized protein YkwD